MSKLLEDMQQLVQVEESDNEIENVDNILSAIVGLTAGGIIGYKVGKLVQRLRVALHLDKQLNPAD
jgi:hypothetical protein